MKTEQQAIVRLRRCSYVAIATALFWSAAAHAQVTEEERPPTDEEIIVTGTNISGVKPVGSETIALDRDAILATGATDVAGVLQTLPQVQNNPSAGGQVFRQGGTGNNGTVSGGGKNSTQGTAINLRSQGAAATLILVDGRRVAPTGTLNAFTEAVQVPIAALERIEVVTDGASAIYGSDAIAGVVNYVLRKNLDGVEISLRDTYNDLYNQFGGSITAGTTWDNGNVILTYDYDHRDRMRASKSPYLRRNLTPFGLPDGRAYNATVTAAGPTLITGGTATPYGYFTVPQGAGTGLTFAQLTPGANVLEGSEYDDYLGKQDRHQVAAFLNQELTPNLEFFFEGFFTRRKTYSENYAGGLAGNTAIVCQASPYFITGAPADSVSNQAVCGGGPGQRVAVNAIDFFGTPQVTDNYNTTYTLTAGATWKLPKSWEAEYYVTYGYDKSCGNCNYGSSYNQAALAAQITAGNINPYQTTPLTDAQRATFLGDTRQISGNKFVDTVLKFNGPLFPLPGGEVRAAFGAGYTWNQQSIFNASNTGNQAVPSDNTYRVTSDDKESRRQKSLFAEIYIPVVGEDMNVPLMQSLAVNAAIRYDKYSDFGSTTNPKIGATWEVTDSLSVRGSWGTAFRAPALNDTNVNNFSAGIAGIPLPNGTTSIPSLQFIPGIPCGLFYDCLASGYIAFGGNPDLGPETATTWSAGVDFQPRSIPGLKVAATYYNLKYKDQIILPPAFNFLDNEETFQLYAGRYAIPVNNPVGCVEGNPATYDPVLRDFLAGFQPIVGNTILGYCSVSFIGDGRWNNAAITKQDGLDFQFLYAIPAGESTVTVGANVTKILTNEIQAVAGGPVVDQRDVLNYPVSLRGRGQLSWARKNIGVDLFMNYTGSYTNDRPYPTGSAAVKVKEWVTFDLGARYAFKNDNGIFNGLRASVNVINVFNKAPPRALIQTENGFAAFDGNNANIFGRYAVFNITKSF